MAYRRYGRSGDWYIYWESSSAKSKEDERLAVWHIDHRASRPNFSYREIQDMLAVHDFGRVPGSSTQETDVLRRAFEELVADVDTEYRQRAS